MCSCTCMYVFISICMYVHMYLSSGRRDLVEKCYNLVQKSPPQVICSKPLPGPSRNPRGSIFKTGEDRRAPEQCTSWTPPLEGPTSESVSLTYGHDVSGSLNFISVVVSLCVNVMRLMVKKACWINSFIEIERPVTIMTVLQTRTTTALLWPYGKQDKI